jgi:hypothetical protein
VEPWRRSSAVLLALVLGCYLAGGGARSTLALMTESNARNATFTTAASFDTVAPTVSSSVISKTTLYWPGFVKQGGTYFVYANVTDGGVVPSGVNVVTANVTNVTTGQTAVALVPGSFTIGGVAYNYRSASVTASNPLAAGSKSYTITASDVAGNSATTSGFSVTVDNTAPTGTNVQSANAGIAGRPEIGDTITLTFSEVIDPETVLAGWAGASTNVVLRITNAGSGDTVTVRNAANSAQLPLGTVNLVGTGYLTMTRDFGATVTQSTMVAAGNTIVITLGTASGAVTTQATGNNMTWVPAAGTTDRAANACMTTTATESGTLDLDF